MATNRTRRTRGRRELPCSAEVWGFLTDNPLQSGDEGFNAFARFVYSGLGDDRPGYRSRLREVWEQHREAVLAWWVGRHPGTRPRCWWRYDALPGQDAPPRRQQTAYLKRHGLLTAEELEWLASHPEALQPEPV